MFYLYPCGNPRGESDQNLLIVVNVHKYMWKVDCIKCCNDIILGGMALQPVLDSFLNTSTCILVVLFVYNTASGMT